MYVYAAILILLAFIAGFVVGFMLGLDELKGRRRK